MQAHRVSIQCAQWCLVLKVSRSTGSSSFDSHGSYGTAYLVRDTSNKTLYAMKKIVLSDSNHADRDAALREVSLQLPCLLQTASCSQCLQIGALEVAACRTRRSPCSVLTLAGFLSRRPACCKL
jgi:hypothetical protein